jgi:hypothetical protein
MNSYDRLRPWTDIEACDCEIVTKLLLIDLLTDNPIHCGVCRREVDPQRIELTAKETDFIASWFSVSSALYRLWLNSGEYEQYAKERLLDPNGQVNRDGREIAITLSIRLPTRLWYFHDTDDGEITHCPVCNERLDTAVKFGTGTCHSCRIQI